MKRKYTQGLDAAIKQAGGQAQLAALLGVRQSYVSNWRNRGGRVPAERVLDIEKVTGVHRCELRPDLYPRELRNETRSAYRQD